MLNKKTVRSNINQKICKEEQQKYLQIDKLAKFYKQCSKENFKMGDQGQTFQQFISMKDIEPNQEGTGRISFKDIKKIECLLITKSNQQVKINSKLYESKLKNITQFLDSFINIKAQFLSYSLELVNNNIIDPNRNLVYSIRRNKQRIDALQMLDLLTEYKNQQTLLIAFIDENIYQFKSDIYGRACGNGVAIIDIKMLFGSQNQETKFYQTCIHQTLHTLGFDHCLAWSCLMNPLVAGDMWLCPSCLKKLHSEIEIQLVEWVKRINSLFNKFLKSNKLLLRKSQKILQFLVENSHIKE